MKVIILAGGSGKRLWPLSTEECPKQFLSIIDNESFLQKTIKRFENAEFVDEILVLTNEKYKNLTHKHIEDINLQKEIKVLVEPCRKNTAPAITLAMSYFQKNNKKDFFKALVIPSDHMISPVEKFLDYLRKIEDSKFDKIVTFGIKPTKPAIGYGYIKIGKEKLNDFLFKVEKFVEKPSLEKAKIFVLSQKYLWNSGMLMFSNQCFFSEMRKHSKDIFDFCNQGFDSLLDNFHKMPSISIDYALMEKTNKTAVCPMNLEWSDIGSFESLYDILKK